MIQTEKLQQKIDEKGFNANSLASKSGVDKSIISRVLNGETKSCSIETAKKLSKALELTGEESALIFLH